jgi:adenylate cyclase, class 2
MPGAKYHETEVKIAFNGTPEQARALIEERGYSLIESRTLETDQLFDRAGELRGSDQLLRLRRTRNWSGDRSTITYKGPGLRGRHKSREEIEFDVSHENGGPDAFTLVLDRLGYQPTFRYEKYRTKFAAQGEPGIITIDETPIGVFLEIEGEAEWIDTTAARLGYSHSNYLTCSYASLYRKYREANTTAPENMIFPSNTSL